MPDRRAAPTRSRPESLARRRIEAVGVGRRRGTTQGGKARAVAWQPPVVGGGGDPQLWKKLTAVSAALFVAVLIVAVATSTL